MEEIIYVWCWLHNRISDKIAKFIFFIPCCVDCWKISMYWNDQFYEMYGRRPNTGEIKRICKVVVKRYFRGYKGTIGRFVNRQMQLSDWLSPVRIEL